jgi:plastocyanin
MKNPTTKLGALLVALVLALAACGGDDPAVEAPATDDAPAAGDEVEEPADDTGDAAADDAAEAPADGNAVTVQGFRFDPSELTVAVGDTVVWTNMDGIDHTATSGTADAPDGAFDVDMPEQGTSGEHTFTEAGTFAYFCEVHTSMTGTITVE